MVNEHIQVSHKHAKLVRMSLILRVNGGNGGDAEVRIT